MSDFALFLGASSLLCASLAYKRHTRSRNGVRRSNPADGERRRHARSDAEPFRPFIIGVAGASGSGKTTVCRRIVDALEDKGRRVAVIASDAYYKPLGGSDPATHNFDEPNAIDFELLAKHVELLKAGETIEVPHYDFVTHSRLPSSTRVGNVDVVIVEGILIFFGEPLRKLFDLRLFAMEDPDVCLVRRLRRDIHERGRDVESVLQQYETFVKPALEAYIQPSMTHADVILPRAGHNTVALRLLLREVRARMQDRDRAQEHAEAMLR